MTDTKHTLVTDWKALALEAGNKLAWAVCRIKAPGLVYDFNTSTSKRWEDDVIETLEKFPGAKIDREGIMEKYLSAKERARKKSAIAKATPQPSERK